MMHILFFGAVVQSPKGRSVSFANTNLEERIVQSVPKTSSKRITTKTYTLIGFIGLTPGRIVGNLMDGTNVEEFSFGVEAEHSVLIFVVAESIFDSGDVGE